MSTVLCVIKITIYHPFLLSVTQMKKDTIVDVNFRRSPLPPCKLLSTFGDTLPPPLELMSIKNVPQLSYQTLSFFLPSLLFRATLLSNSYFFSEQLSYLGNSVTRHQRVARQTDIHPSENR